MCEKINLDVLPQPVLERIENLGIPRSEIRLYAQADLTMKGGTASIWVVSSDRMLAAVPEQKGMSDEVVLELKRVETVRIRCRMGSAFLQAKIEGFYVDVARFTNRFRFRFERFATQMQNLLQGRPVNNTVVNEPNPLACKVCLFPLQSEISVCPRCANQKAVLFRVLGLLSPHLVWIVVVLVLMSISVVLSLVPPQLIRILVDQVLTTQKHVHWLIWLVAALVGAELLKTQLSIFVGTLSTSVGTLITYDVRTRLFNKLQELSIDYYDRNSIGTLMTRLSGDVEALQGFVTQAGQGLLLNVFLLIGIGVMLFVINPVLAVYVMIPIPFVIFASIFFWRRIYPRHFKFWESQAKMSNFLNGVLSGIRLVKAFAQEEREKERFSAIAAHQRDSNRSVSLSVAAFNPTMTFLFSLGGLIVWYAGGRHVLAGRLSLGQLMAFLSYIGMFYAPLSGLTTLSNWFSSFTSASHRIFEILDTESLLTDPPKPVRLKQVRGSIEMDHATFGYDPYFPIIKDISLKIEPGQLIGIVGKSGSGKTTLVNLICRFYDVQKGSVRIDGHDVRELSSTDLRRNIGLVLQEPFLFRGTLAENIAYGMPDATFPDIIQAAKAAQAHDFIMRLQGAYDFMLGERGAGLSGGEKQRISIARALLLNPPILILDEATSSVDTEAEEKIQKALAVLCKGRTTIAIAHRISTLRGADRIYFVDEGRIVEEGTHEELMCRRGLYWRLVQIQSQLSKIDVTD